MRLLRPKIFRDPADLRLLLFPEIVLALGSPLIDRVCACNSLRFTMADAGRVCVRSDGLFLHIFMPATRHFFIGPALLAGRCRLTIRHCVINTDSAILYTSIWRRKETAVKKVPPRLIYYSGSYVTWSGVTLYSI